MTALAWSDLRAFSCPGGCSPPRKPVVVPGSDRRADTNSHGVRIECRFPGRWWDRSDQWWDRSDQGDRNEQSSFGNANADDDDDRGLGRARDRAGTCTAERGEEQQAERRRGPRRARPGAIRTCRVYGTTEHRHRSNGPTVRQGGSSCPTTSGLQSRTRSAPVPSADPQTPRPMSRSLTTTSGMTGASR